MAFKISSALVSMRADRGEPEVLRLHNGAGPSEASTERFFTIR
jgi:hypothetical protein